MNEFEECRHLVERIQRKYEKIEYIREKLYAPKAQIITGMPRGGASDNSIEKYLSDIEEEEAKIKSLKQILSEKWFDIVERLYRENVKDENILLMQERFLNCRPWVKCAEYMQQQFPQSKWNVNKCFRVYRDNIYKLNKKKT